MITPEKITKPLVYSQWQSPTIGDAVYICEHGIVSISINNVISRFKFVYNGVLHKQNLSHLVPNEQLIISEAKAFVDEVIAHHQDTSQGLWVTDIEPSEEDKERLKMYQL